MIIGIDTSTPAVSIALGDESGLVASLRLLQGRRHVETVMPAVEQLLAHAGCTYSDVSGIAVDRGPGLFTGLRVGVATAKALALAIGVPVYAASSLEIMVRQWADMCERVGASGSEPTNVLGVIDARRRELYAQRFTVAGTQVVAVGDPTCAAPSEVLALLNGCGVARVVGDAAVGSAAFADFAVNPGSPDASTLVLMVGELTQTEPDELELLYLRAPDAEINWSSRP